MRDGGLDVRGAARGVVLDRRAPRLRVAVPRAGWPSGGRGSDSPARAPRRGTARTSLLGGGRKGPR